MFNVSSVPKVKHPAQYSDSIIAAMVNKLGMLPGNLLDPMAGPGLSLPAFEMPGRTITGVEIEPEWADVGPYNIQGDATRLPDDWTSYFNIIVVSPCYGNRFSDSFNAKDSSVRRSYTHDLRAMLNDNARKLNINNTGYLPFFNSNYKKLHEQAWSEVTRVSASGCMFLLNVSDFIKDGKQVPVSVWHLNLLCQLGWVWKSAEIIQTPRMRYGENYKARVDGEWLFELRLP